MSERILRRTVIVGGALALAMTAWFAGRSSSLSAADVDGTPTFSNVAVDCEPTQQALVRQVEVKGEARTVVQCATVTAEPAFVADAVSTHTPALIPAVYRAPSPAPALAAAPARTSRAVQPAAPVAASAPQRTVAERTTPERSWQKRALVIGGSAGAGAGIGALIGGKKGALIGAAIGGGSGTVYEVVKH